jgi:hypothetical protein
LFGGDLLLIKEIIKLSIGVVGMVGFVIGKKLDN